MSVVDTSNRRERRRRLGNGKPATAFGAIHSCRCGARDAAEQLQPIGQLTRNVPHALELRDPAAVDEQVADDTAAARCVCLIGCQLTHWLSPSARRVSRGPGRLRGGADASAHSLYLTHRTTPFGEMTSPACAPVAPGCQASQALMTGGHLKAPATSVSREVNQAIGCVRMSCRGNVVLSLPQPLRNAQCGRFAQVSCSLSRHVTLFNRAA